MCLMKKATIYKENSNSIITLLRFPFHLPLPPKKNVGQRAKGKSGNCGMTANNEEKEFPRAQQKKKIFCRKVGEGGRATAASSLLTNLPPPHPLFLFFFRNPFFLSFLFSLIRDIESLPPFDRSSLLIAQLFSLPGRPTLNIDKRGRNIGNWSL